MMILTGKTIRSALRSAVSVRRRVRLAVPVRAAPVLASAADHDRVDHLRRGRACRRRTSSRCSARSTASAASSCSPAIREIAPADHLGIVARGRRGTAITADLGARKIREELDALQVLGVDPVKNLVVPRFLALMVVTGAVRRLRDPVRHLRRHRSRSSSTASRSARSWRTLFAERLDHRPVGLGAEDARCFGAIIAIVCCYKGMTRLRRRRGRRRAVNQARRDVPAGHRRVQLRVHPDAARHASEDPRDQVMGELLAIATRMAVRRGRDRRVHGPRRARRCTACACSASSARRSVRRGC